MLCLGVAWGCLSIFLPKQQDEMISMSQNAIGTVVGGDQRHPENPSNETDSSDFPSASVKNTEDDEEFRHRRALGHWNFIKSLNNQRQALFKSGEKISLTTSEATFLNMLAKARLDLDHVDYVKSNESITDPKSKGETTEHSSGSDKRMDSDGDAHLQMNELKRSGRNTFFVDLVKAAVAKERLRDTIAERLSHLSGPEVKFLTKLVNNDDVTLQALENAVHVLDTDPIYNPPLRRDDSGEEAEAEVKRRNQSSRTSDGIESRRIYRRKASSIEKSLWRMSTSGVDDDDITDRDETTVGSSVAMANKSKYACKANVHEICTWEMPTAKELGKEKGKIIDLGGVTEMEPKPLEESNDDQMSLITGDGQKQPTGNGPESKIRVGLEELLARQRDIVGANAEKMKAPMKMTMERASFLCCGIGSARFDENDITKPRDQEFEDCSDGRNVDENSLQSKIRYLHLNQNVLLDRHLHLSTWLGSPEDYPILGIGDVKSDNNEEKHDPLDPHVLSPLLMKSLREHLPYALREENFWLKYSLVRDGASLETMFSTLRHSQRTILAIETSEGEVLGSFTSTPWRNNGNSFYGSCESFVWMLRKQRRHSDGEDDCTSLDEYILRESSLEVFPWDHKGNRNVQLSNMTKLYVGGGHPEDEVMDNVEQFWKSRTVSTTAKEQWGMSIALDKDLLRGTTSKCATFGGSPPLIRSARNDGSSIFEVMNMEVWALTPCMTEELAEELELGRTFVMTGGVFGI